MRFQLLESILALAYTAAAIDFTDYDPQPGVPADFKPFLESLVNAAEDGNITTGYTDYFPADGMQTTLTLHCVGVTRIQACKSYFLSDGRQLVHFPNTTFVAHNNATATVYEVLGRIENTYVAENCSQIYYKTQYTVLKSDQRKNAFPNLSAVPQQQIYWYHDYFVNPTTVPSDIPCDSQRV